MADARNLSHTTSHLALVGPVTIKPWRQRAHPPAGRMKCTIIYPGHTQWVTEQDRRVLVLEPMSSSETGGHGKSKLPNLIATLCRGYTIHG